MKEESKFTLKPVQKMWLTFWLMIFDVVTATIIIGDYILGINTDSMYLLMGMFLVLVAVMLGRTSYHHYKEVYLKQF